MCTGLFGLPLWLFARRYLPASILSMPALGFLAISGRAVCACVELWAVSAYLKRLLQQDVKARMQTL